MKLSAKKDRERIENILENESYHQGRNRIVHDAGKRAITIDIFTNVHNVEGEEDTVLYEVTDSGLDEFKVASSDLGDEQDISLIMIDMYYTQVLKRAYFTTEKEALKWANKRLKFSY